MIHCEVYTMKMSSEAVSQVSDMSGRKSYGTCRL